MKITSQGTMFSSVKPPSLVMPMILFNTLNRPLPAVPRKVLRSYGGKGIVGVKTRQSVGEIATLTPKIIMNKKIRRCPVSGGVHAVTSILSKRQPSTHIWPSPSEDRAVLSIKY